MKFSYFILRGSNKNNILREPRDEIFIFHFAGQGDKICSCIMSTYSSI